MNIVPVNYVFAPDTINEDGLVNITALATAYTKATNVRCNVSEWLDTKEAKESIAFLASYSEIPQSKLVKIVRGGNAGGTWVHPDLAEIFAQWVSVEYRFAVISLIRQAKQEKLPQTFAEALMLAAKQQLAIENAEKQNKLQQAHIAVLQEAVEQQAEIIDELFDYSSIIRIAKYNQVNPDCYKWQQLKAASKVLSLEVKQAPCAIWGTKNLYSHEAWKLAYPGAELPEITAIVNDASNHHQHRHHPTPRRHLPTHCQTQ